VLPEKILGLYVSSLPKGGRIMSCCLLRHFARISSALKSPAGFAALRSEPLAPAPPLLVLGRNLFTMVGSAW